MSARILKEAPKGQTIALPNIPKTTDDKSRIRYMTDYDKYESELLKHHLGPPETTYTMGLKDVPVEFNRKVPGLGEPTAAEREYERNLQLKYAKRKSKFRYHAIAGIKPRTLSFYKPPVLQQAAAADRVPGVSSAAVSPSVTGGGGGEATTEEQSAAAKNSATATPTLPVDSTGDDRSQLVSPRQRAASVQKSSAVGTDPSSKENNPAPTASVSSATFVGAATAVMNGHRVSKKTAGVTAPAVPAASTPPLPPSATPSKPEPTTQPKTAGGRPPAATVPTPQKRATLQSTPSTGHTRPTTVRSVSPSTTSTSAVQAPTAQQIGEALMAAAPPVTPGAQILRMHRTAGSTKPPQTYIGGSAAEVEESACLLRALIRPPLEFSASFKISTKFLDLEWLDEDRPSPNRSVNLSNWQGSGTRRDQPRLNSPRSALVLLRNGITADDLVIKPPVEDESLPGDDAVVREAVKQFRAERETARRRELQSALLSEYLALCARVPLPELISAFRRPPGTHIKDTSALPTTLMLRLERQQKIFEVNKLRAERQDVLANDVEERRRVAEARQMQAEAEALAATELKAKQEAQARLLQQQRLAAQKQKNREMETAYLRALEERMIKAEERNKERVEARERMQQQQHAQRQALEEERRRRFERSAAAQQEQVLEVDMKRRQKELKLEAIQHEREARMEEERQHLTEKQSKAAAARAEAKERAQALEEKQREAALSRQRVAEERVERFQRAREEEFKARDAEEAVKQERRQMAFAQAMEKEEELKARTREKRSKYEAAHEQMQQRKQMELAIKRETEREEMNEKSFAVLKKQRMDEFGKLHVISKLIEKRRAANFITEQREAMLEAMMKERGHLQSERERLKRESVAPPF